MKEIGIIAAVIGALILFFPRRSQGSNVTQVLDQIKPLPTLPGGIVTDPIVIEKQVIIQSDAKETRDANVAAFLDLIKWAEGTNTRLGLDPYRVTFGYNHTIQSFADHPFLTGEWPGVTFFDPARNANNLTTASGAYQITKTTWNDLRTRHAALLPDFTPNSQDTAAVILLEEEGALDDIIAGNIKAAILNVSNRWASFPGSTSGQPQRVLDDMIDRYKRYGGFLNSELA